MIISGDGLAILRAICADPLEDTPRLGLADWLHENASDDPLYAPLAAFIRSGCELARTPATVTYNRLLHNTEWTSTTAEERARLGWRSFRNVGGQAVGVLYYDLPHPAHVELSATVATLFAAHGRAWFGDARWTVTLTEPEHPDECPTCHGNLLVSGVLPARGGGQARMMRECPDCLGPDGVPTGRPTRPRVVVARGLPAVVYATLEQWRGGACPVCYGEGYHGDGYGVSTRCPTCRTKRTVPGIGRDLARWPVTVSVTDKEPWPFALADGSTAYVWSEDDGTDPARYTLPPALFVGAVRDVHPTAAAAHAALSAALIAEARA